MKHYDYIFTGAGLSALMTVYEMTKHPYFSKASVLLLDQNTKNTNDRTWCFWDYEEQMDNIVSKKWSLAKYADAHFERNLELQPYQYKMIKGLDFYQHVFKAIATHGKIEFSNQKVTDFVDLNTHCEVTTDTQKYSCNKLLNSIYNPKIINNQTKYPLLQQHFIGWFIKSKEAVFNPEMATFMDFSVEQKQNTRFMYVLPTSSNEALLEYTLFSKDLLPKAEYENEIELYIKKLGITNYEIIEKEQGNIPMTSYQFWKHNSKNIVQIGSAGGWTKASTGYTFKNSIKKSKALIQFLIHQNDFKKLHKRDKFWLYDMLFLDVLYRRNDLGSSVFSALFKKGNPTLVFKFLDEETSIWEDLQVIWKCPKGLFVRALLERVLKF
jgi:lycopene beta-cyclase